MRSRRTQNAVSPVDISKNPSHDHSRPGDRPRVIIEATKLREIRNGSGKVVRMPTKQDIKSSLRQGFKNVLKNVRAADLTDEEKSTLLKEFVSKAGHAIQALEPPQLEDNKVVDLSGIPVWKGRKQDGMPLDFLSKHYGKWLAAFGAKRDLVFQDQIRAHDPRLIKGIHNQFQEESQLQGTGNSRKVHDFVKTRSARLDEKLKNSTIEDIKANPRLAAAFYSRGKRAGERKQSLG